MRVARARDYLARRRGAERVDPEGRLVPLAGVESGYWLVVSRRGGDQNIGATIDAVAKCRGGRLVVVGHPARPLMAHDPRVHYTGVVSEAELRWAYTNARGLIAMSPEGSGLTPIEANSFGTPVLALRVGGFLQTVVEGVTGVYVDRPASFEIARALRDFPTFDAATIRRHAAHFARPPETTIGGRARECAADAAHSRAQPPIMEGIGWATRSGGST
jgi:glycosyltransferase involved in cell wall biosynthesis